jgi:hypothetical protein
VSVLKSLDGGATYSEAEAPKLAAHPVHIALQGVCDETTTLLSHPTFVDSRPDTGLYIAALGGGWSAERTCAASGELSAEVRVPSFVAAPYVASGSTTEGVIGDVNNDGVIERLDVTLINRLVAWGETRLNGYLDARGMNPVDITLADVDLDGEVCDWDAQLLHLALRLGKDAVNAYLSDHGLPLCHVGEALSR